MRPTISSPASDRRLRSRVPGLQPPSRLLASMDATHGKLPERDDHYKSRGDRNRRRTVETMNTDHGAGFLARYAPFDALAPGELALIAASAEERTYAAGESILIEDGTPSEHLFVVRGGSVELLHQGEVVDILGPGESFGQPSLLTGLAPAFTVRAREATVCLLIPREQAIAVFTDPAGAAHLARTLRSRLVHAGH